jgi:hypothetical protein
MKALRGNDRIVEYLDSEMKRLEGRREGGPGWEVFILMEFCGGESAGSIYKYTIGSISERRRLLSRRWWYH